MVIYLLATYIIFNVKYTYGRKKVKNILCYKYTIILYNIPF